MVNPSSAVTASEEITISNAMKRENFFTFFLST
jgi:hypothetical protein